MSKNAQAAILRSLSFQFQDEVSMMLDSLMNGSAQERQDLARGFCQAHNAVRGAEYLSVEELAGVSFDVSDVIMDGDSFTAEEVLKVFSDLGFRTEGSKIFYDNPFINPGRAQEIAQPKIPSPIEDAQSHALELQSYLKSHFVCDVMEANENYTLEERLDEHNSTNEYNAADRDAFIPQITLKDFAGLSISAIFENGATPLSGYNINDFKNKLTQLGFSVDGDTLVGHVPAPTAPAAQPSATPAATAATTGKYDQYPLVQKALDAQAKSGGQGDLSPAQERQMLLRTLNVLENCSDFPAAEKEVLLASSVLMLGGLIGPDTSTIETEYSADVRTFIDTALAFDNDAGDGEEPDVAALAKKYGGYAQVMCAGTIANIHGMTDDLKQGKIPMGISSLGEAEDMLGCMGLMMGSFFPLAKVSAPRIEQAYKDAVQQCSQAFKGFRSSSPASKKPPRRPGWY